MIAFEHIEGTAVSSDAAQRRGDIDIGIGIAVTVGIGGEIIRRQIVSDRNVLSNRFTMIASHARHEVLRRFNTSGGGLNGHARNGDGCSGPSWVGVQ